MTLDPREEGQSTCLPVAVQAPKSLEFEPHPSTMRRQLNVTSRHSPVNLVTLFHGDCEIL